ncbi:MAG: hypothetical protein GY925_15465 [Actinomycetia bacterium]|nr:hypothetical protein [bacterium]MCP4960653.1 hypothetical protein [Actinomycetes bacterium]
MELKDVAEWAESFEPKPGLLAFLGNRIGLTGVLAVATFLLPDFVEERGCVLLPWQFEQSTFDEWWESLDGDRSRIEDVINHTHLWDLFASRPDDPLEQHAIESLGRLVANSWERVLGADFPDRSFTVTCSNDPDTDYGPTVTFYSDHTDHPV